MAVAFESPALWRRILPWFRGFDGPLIAAVLMLAAAGMLTMYSSGHDHGTRFQDHGRNMLIAGGITAGLGAAFIVTSVVVTSCDYDNSLKCKFGNQRDFLVPTAVATTALLACAAETSPQRSADSKTRPSSCSAALPWLSAAPSRSTSSTTRARCRRLRSAWRSTRKRSTRVASVHAR